MLCDSAPSEWSRGSKAFRTFCFNELREWRASGLATERRISENIGQPAKIRIGAYDSVGIYFFPHLLRSVQKKKLNAQLELHLNRSQDILREVADGILDIGLVFSGNSTPTELRIKRVAHDEFGFYESLSGRTSDDLYSLFESGDDTGKTIPEHMKELGLSHRGMVDAPSFEVAAALTVAGLGVGVLPTRVARSFIEQKKLRTIQIIEKKTFGKNHLSVVRAKSNQDKVVESVVQLIESEWSSPLFSRPK